MGTKKRERTQCTGEVPPNDNCWSGKWTRCERLAAPGETRCWQHGGRKMNAAERETARERNRKARRVGEKKDEGS